MPNETPKCSREACPAVMLWFGKSHIVWLCDTEQCDYVRIQTRNIETTREIAKMVVEKKNERP